MVLTNNKLGIDSIKKNKSSPVRIQFLSGFNSRNSTRAILSCEQFGEDEKRMSIGKDCQKVE